MRRFASPWAHRPGVRRRKGDDNEEEEEEEEQQRPTKRAKVKAKAKAKSATKAKTKANYISMEARGSRTIQATVRGAPQWQPVQGIQVRQGPRHPEGSQREGRETQSQCVNKARGGRNAPLAGEAGACARRTAPMGRLRQAHRAEGPLRQAQPAFWISAEKRI